MRCSAVVLLLAWGHALRDTAGDAPATINITATSHHQLRVVSGRGVATSAGLGRSTTPGRDFGSSNFSPGRSDDQVHAVSASSNDLGDLGSDTLPTRDISPTYAVSGRSEAAHVGLGRRITQAVSNRRSDHEVQAGTAISNGNGTVSGRGKGGNDDLGRGTTPGRDYDLSNFSRGRSDNEVHSVSASSNYHVDLGWEAVPTRDTSSSDVNLGRSDAEVYDASGRSEAAHVDLGRGTTPGRHYGLSNFSGERSDDEVHSVLASSNDHVDLGRDTLPTRDTSPSDVTLGRSDAEADVVSGRSNVGNVDLGSGTTPRTSDDEECGDPGAGCTRRCCERGHRLDAAGKCSPAVEDTFLPRLRRWPDLGEAPSRHLGQLRGLSCALGKYQLRPDRDPDDAFHLLEDGRLFVSGMSGKPFNVTEFCVEPVDEAGTVLAAFLCFPEQDGVVRQVALAYPVCMLVSLPCLAATFLAYAAVPRLRNLHGQVLMCHVASLFLLYLMLAAVDLGVFQPGERPCLVAAFVVYFSFLASFFWLNVMCFDIWWTFSGYRPLRGSEKEREHKKFVFYSIYAWGSPMLLLLVCLLMNLLPNMPEHVVAPQIGKERCWFSTRQAEAAYFYGPMALIVVCNIILFVLTALRIVKLKKETAMLKGEESRRHDVEENKQRFVLYLKLFVVMGVNWGMEVISFMVRGPQYLWYVTDIGNTLQGVLIFLIFVWKDKIRRLLARRLCPRLARADTRRGSSRKNGRLSKSVASPTSSFSLTTTKATTNGSSETARMTREESEEV